MSDAARDLLFQKSRLPFNQEDKDVQPNQTIDVVPLPLHFRPDDLRHSALRLVDPASACIVRAYRDRYADQTSASLRNEALALDGHAAVAIRLPAAGWFGVARRPGGQDRRPEKFS